MTQTVRRTGDDRIQHAVVQRLEWAPDVRSAHIGVAVTDGAVTLAGEAATVREKTAALREATRVPGVDAVVDEIVVRDRLQTVHDADIARETQRMLVNHPQLREQSIVAAVRDHVVTLTGWVDRPGQQDAAARATFAIAGVQAVLNEIAVRPVPTIDAVRAHLAAAMVADGGRPIANLHVEIDGSVLAMRGNVHSWYERRIADRAARAIPGVTEVRNELVVVF
jgi:osmotically-inducible protein OsmY